MKLHKLIVLTVALLLPVHGLLADNVNGHYQYGVTGSVQKAPAKTASKLKIVTPIRQGVVVANPVANSDPTTTIIKPAVRTQGELKISRPKPRGSNLTVSVAYEHDACAIHPSPLGDNIFNAGCDVIVKIKNHGGSTTSEANTIQVNMSYSNRTGTVQILRFIPALKANEEKTIIIHSGFIHGFKKASSFTAVVDRPQNIIETNENDNTAVFWLGL